MVCENGDQVPGQLVVAGSGSWQTLSCSPWVPRVSGETRGVGCLRLTALLTGRLASGPGDLKVITLAPHGQPGPVKGELRVFQGDFPRCTWRCVQTNFVGSYDSVNSHGLLCLSAGTLERPRAISGSLHEVLSRIHLSLFDGQHWLPGLHSALGSFLFH